MFLAKMGLKKPTHYLLMLLAAGALFASPAHAQISNVDPNDAIDADLGTPPAGPDTSLEAAPMAQDETAMQDGVPTDGWKDIFWARKQMMVILPLKKLI